MDNARKTETEVAVGADSSAVAVTPSIGTFLRQYWWKLLLALHLVYFGALPVMLLMQMAAVAIGAPGAGASEVTLAFYALVEHAWVPAKVLVPFALWLAYAVSRFRATEPASTRSEAACARVGHRRNEVRHRSARPKSGVSCPSTNGLRSSSTSRCRAACSSLPSVAASPGPCRGTGRGRRRLPERRGERRCSTSAWSRRGRGPVYRGCCRPRRLRSPRWAGSFRRARAGCFRRRSGLSGIRAGSRWRV